MNKKEALERINYQLNGGYLDISNNQYDDEEYKLICEIVDKYEKYKWHDLQKNPYDLPEDDVGVLTACRINGTYGYNLEYYNHCTSLWEFRNGEVDLAILSAWRYIETFESEE